MGLAEGEMIVTLRRQLLMMLIAAFPATVAADALLVVDGAGVVLGYYVGRLESSGDRVIVTGTGYEFMISAFGTRLLTYDRTTRFYYESADCTGQAYADEFFSGVVTRRSGQLFYIPKEPTRVLATDLNIQTYSDGKFCELVNGQPLSYFEAFDNDPAITGVGRTAFVNPISVNVQVSDGLFCNGFENCPNP